MSEEKDVARSDAELWRLARSARDRQGGIEEAERDLLLAAYLDGNLDPESSEAVEGWLAADPVACETLTAARAALAEPPVEVPAAVLERARGLVAGPRPVARPVVRPVAHEGGGWLAEIFGAVPGLLRPTGLATAAAVAIACVAGFQLGKRGAHDAVEIQSLIAQEASLGLRSDDLF